MGFSIPIHKLMLLLAIALAANLDNVGVSAAYGIAKRRLSGWSNLVIALMAIGLTYGAMAFGRVLVAVMPAWVANGVGAGVIALVGVWIYWEAPIGWLMCRFYSWLRYHYHLQTRFTETAPDTIAMRHRRQKDGAAARLQSARPQSVGVRETIILGLSLALNAMAGGLGASLSGHNPVITSLAVGVFSYLTIAIGQMIAGTYLSQRLGAWAPKVSGLLLIAIGIYELFD